MKLTWAFVFVLTMILWSAYVAAQSGPGNPKNGQLVYQQQCVRCHGEALDGRGPEAGSLVVAPANFHARRSRVKTDFELWLAIKQGVIFSPMHAWRDRLTEQQIEDVIAYIRQNVPHTID